MLVKSRVIRAFFGLAVVLVVGLTWLAVRPHPDAAVTDTAALSRAATAPKVVDARQDAATKPAGTEAGRASKGRSELAAGAAQVLGHRFPEGRVRDERLEVVSAGRERWIQWIETPGAFPQVRAELTFESDEKGLRLVEEHYVLADSVLVERPRSVSPSEFAARLRGLGLRAGPQYDFSPAVRVFVPDPLHLDSVPEALGRLGSQEPGP